ncbi:kinase domain protein [Kitasatospora cheerisanensis KCTC 2395]|uniref:non-specific serine/threonine protein kinase n=1 Tax=Kitasatospora cheerisanensis KCTC 2395 TaxID=1348663 RepID=A0A066YUV6_9ACTN|nr:kinase domain protein [Kitasatospora cheerisanensis KCTC 2395]
MPVPAGYRLGPWAVGTPLGAGGFGSVYTARREDDGQPADAALKFLPTGTQTPRRLRHLRELAEREIDLLSRVRAPRLIRLHEVRTVDDPSRPELDGATVLVLDRAESSLQDLLNGSPRPGRGPELLVEICEGLHQLHRAGWLHGDLKPANVLLMDDGSARLADFNLAAELEGTHAYSPMFSTPDYTPPETIWGDVAERGQRIRPTTDIWAFGVLAHLVLTGTLPLPGATPAARRDATVRYARGTEPLRLSPELPPDWRQIITDCLAPTHQERAPHDAASLLPRVRAAAEGAAAPRAPRAARPLRRALIALACAGALAAAGLGLHAASSKHPATTGSSPRSAPVALVGYDRCLKGNVCFFTEPDGNGRMCSWEGDETDWLGGASRCSWADQQVPRSVFNNGIGPEAGEPRVSLVYYAGEKLQDRIDCLPRDTRQNIDLARSPRSHVWTEHC